MSMDSEDGFARGFVAGWEARERLQRERDQEDAKRRLNQWAQASMAQASQQTAQGEQQGQNLSAAR